MMQEAALAPELRVREQVDLVASYYPAPLPVDAVLEKTRIAALARRPYGKLSGGQKRQVQLALAIVGRPQLLFLDEPTVGLDPQARELLWATMRELVDQGAAIVLTTVRMLRSPGFAMPFLGMPILLYLLFAVLIAGAAAAKDPNVARFLFSGFAIFGVVGPGMFGFGVRGARRRDGDFRSDCAAATGARGLTTRRAPLMAMAGPLRQPAGSIAARRAPPRRALLW